MALPKSNRLDGQPSGGGPRGRQRLLRSSLAFLVLLVPALAGCSNPFANPTVETRYTDLEGYSRDTTGRDKFAWPDLDGVTLTILDNGAFAAFDDAAKLFRDLTGATVVLERGEDTGGSLKKLKDSRASGKYDILYGIDNMRYSMGVRDNLFVEYKPNLADRIDADLVFFGAGGPWYATPVDHGFIGINAADFADPARNGTLVNRTDIDSLSAVRTYADQFVTSHPEQSSPGLGFFLVTVAQFGENPAHSPSARYDWRHYWRDLFVGTDRNGDRRSEGCVLVVADWTIAYEQHFSGGYGADSGGLADRAIVTSYSESPAIEVFFGRDPAAAAFPLVADGSTYHHIQAMAIANGTKNLQAAQAWVEFSLTDAFQELAAPQNVVYPVVSSPSVDASVEEAYQGLDPTPGSFRTVRFPPDFVADNYDRWMMEWKGIMQDPSIDCRAG